MPTPEGILVDINSDVVQWLKKLYYRGSFLPDSYITGISVYLSTLAIYQLQFVYKFK